MRAVSGTHTSANWSAPSSEVSTLVGYPPTTGVRLAVAPGYPQATTIGAVALQPPTTPARTAVNPSSVENGWCGSAKAPRSATCPRSPAPPWATAGAEPHHSTRHAVGQGVPDAYRGSATDRRCVLCHGRNPVKDPPVALRPPQPAMTARTATNCPTRAALNGQQLCQTSTSTSFVADAAKPRPELALSSRWPSGANGCAARSSTPSHATTVGSPTPSSRRGR